MRRVRRRPRRRPVSITPPGKGARTLLRLFLLAAALIASVAILNGRLRPLITSMALAVVKNHITNVIEQAVNREITSDEVEYNDLIELDKDTEGKVTALRTNMARINRLQAQLTTAVLHEIQAIPSEDLGIPIGSLTGIDVLNGRGPDVTVRILSVGSVKSAFSNTFTSTGINQTRHRILLTIHAEVRVLLPGYSVKTEVDTPVNVAETVIVGGVPGNYTYFSQFDTPEEAAGYYFDYGAGLSTPNTSGSTG